VKNHRNISTNKLHIEAFQNYFKTFESVSVKDIKTFYEKLDKDVKMTTINWRIYALVDNGIIQRIGRGKYSLGKQKEFTPVISNENESLYLTLKEEYPFLDISIWTTQWVAQWMLHIPGTYETIIEVEKGSEESVFYFLSDIRNNVFLNPSKDILNKYAKTEKPIVIIKNLVTSSPLQIVSNVQIPSIEKILVDLIVDNDLFSAYQGRDLTSIIENAFEYNTINMDTLLRYAGRRGKETMVADLINDKR
tara:strand:- start:5780 stop:6526 length:747 start_codon:yes stop_codon:yes gene_type:complete